MRSYPFMAVAAFAVAAAVYGYDGGWSVIPQLANRPSDFENYYLAARNLAVGESPFAVARYDYPPLIAFALWPLAHLSYEAARWVWFLVSHGCILGAAVLTWKALGKDRLAGVVVALVWSCGGTLQENFALGQVNPVLLLLLACAMFGAAGGRPWALGAAIAIKLWPVALLPALGLAGEPGGNRSARAAYRIRPMIVAVAVAIVLVAAPLAMLAAFYPPPHAPTHSGAWMGTPALLNFSVAAAVLRLLDFPASAALPHNWQFGNDMLELRLNPNDAAVSVLISVAAALAGFLVLAFWVYRMMDNDASASQPHHRAARVGNLGDSPLSSEYALAILLPLALATLPLSWSHYQLLELPGAAMFLVLAVRARMFWHAGAVAGLFLATYPLPVALLRVYLQQYGWTAASPWALWLVTALSPAAAIGLFALYFRILQFTSLSKRGRSFALSGL